MGGAGRKSGRDAGQKERQSGVSRGIIPSEVLVVSKRSDKLGSGRKNAGQTKPLAYGSGASRQPLTPPSKLASKDESHLEGHEDLWGDDDALDGASLAIAGGGSAACNEGLNAKVLVLNRAYAAMRVVSAKRAFVLLARNIAEVIHVDIAGNGPDTSDDGAVVRGQYINYDFATWAELSQLQAQFERERHDWVRTVRYDIAVPRIIRLLAYDKLPEHGVKLNRRNLFARDRNRCQYCGRFFSTSDLSIDHVLPRAQGGRDTWENLVCSCIRCNARKGGRTPEQATMKLIKKPERPRRNPLITLRLGHEKYSSWRAFLDNAYWSVELG
jgi:5-methylcytosine-specific restriction endonuclease McrA